MSLSEVSPRTAAPLVDNNFSHFKNSLWALRTCFAGLFLAHVICATKITQRGAAVIDYFAAIVAKKL